MAITEEIPDYLQATIEGVAAFLDLSEDEVQAALKVLPEETKAISKDPCLSSTLEHSPLHISGFRTRKT